MALLDWGKNNLKHINKLERQIHSLQDSLLKTEALLQAANDRIRTDAVVVNDLIMAVQLQTSREDRRRSQLIEIRNETSALTQTINSILKDKLHPNTGKPWLDKELTDTLTNA